MGWPQVGDLAHQAVLRRKAALFALIQCSEAAVPVVLRAALQWDRYAEGQAVIRGTDGLGSRWGGTEGISEHRPPPFPGRRGPHRLQVDMSPLPS